MRVLSVDPGGTTGLCFGMATKTELLVTPEQLRISCSEFWTFLHKWLEKTPSHLICEDFEFRKNARAGLDFTPAHLIGVLKAYHGFHANQYVRMQPASMAKTGFYGTDAALKRCGVHMPNKPHSNDAIRHLLQWFSFGPGYRFNYDHKIVLQPDIDAMKEMWFHGS
jgi:hypothetical protein